MILHPLEKGCISRLFPRICYFLINTAVLFARQKLQWLHSWLGTSVLSRIRLFKDTCSSVSPPLSSRKYREVKNGAMRRSWEASSGPKTLTSSSHESRVGKQRCIRIKKRDCYQIWCWRSTCTREYVTSAGARMCSKLSGSIKASGVALAGVRGIYKPPSPPPTSFLHHSLVMLESKKSTLGHSRCVWRAAALPSRPHHFSCLLFRKNSSYTSRTSLNGTVVSVLRTSPRVAQCRCSMEIDYGAF